MIGLVCLVVLLLLCAYVGLRMEKLIDDEHKRFIGEPVHPGRRVITLRPKRQRGKHCQH